MKITKPKIVVSFLLIALLFCSSGCVLTRSVVDKAVGHTYQTIGPSQIKKGDKVGIYSDGGLAWVIQYPTNRDNSTLKMPEIPKGVGMFYVRKPNIAYYALVPFTFPLDIIFCPFEIVMLPQSH
jgi:hypothetical protein